MNNWETGVRKTGYIVAIALCVCYLATIIPLWAIGIRTYVMPIWAVVAMMMLYPILFFMLGVMLVMKKKFFPIRRSGENDK